MSGKPGEADSPAEPPLDEPAPTFVRPPKEEPTQDLLDSIKQEFREHEDLPNTTNPDDWAKISGKKGERIVYVRTLIHSGDDDDPTGGRSIERVATGQYL